MAYRSPSASFTHGLHCLKLTEFKDELDEICQSNRNNFLALEFRFVYDTCRP